jgi:hypothetical protein
MDEGLVSPDEPFAPKNGQLAPPIGPGPGVTVDEAQLKAIATPVQQ